MAFHYSSSSGDKCHRLCLQRMQPHPCHGLLRVPGDGWDVLCVPPGARQDGCVPPEQLIPSALGMSPGWGCRWSLGGLGCTGDLPLSCLYQTVLCLTGLHLAKQWRDMVRMCPTQRSLSVGIHNTSGQLAEKPN